MGSAMGFRLICCGQPKTIRVIEPNGRLRHFSAGFTISDLLHLYPHHCIGDASGSILSGDVELEGGSTYLLLPLPRAFPGSSSSFVLNEEEEEEEETAIGCSETSILKLRNRMRVWRDSNPRRYSRIPAQEWDDEHNRYNKTARRAMSWQPSLDNISENDSLLQTKLDEQPVKKMKKNTAKYGKSKFNRSSIRSAERKRRLQVFLASPALAF